VSLIQHVGIEFEGVWTPTIIIYIYY